MRKILFAAGLLLGLKAFGYINIHPVAFDKRIDGNGEIQEFMLYNRTEDTLKYGIYLEDEGIKNSMKEWVEFYPSALTIKPGKTGVLKLLVKAPEGTKKGEYLTTVGIKEIALPKEDRSSENSVRILTHLKMDIAGYVGDIRPKITGRNIKASYAGRRLQISGEAENSGERRGHIEVVLSTGKKREDYSLGHLRVLKGEKADLSRLSQEVPGEGMVKNISRYKKVLFLDRDTGKKVGEAEITK